MGTLVHGLDQPSPADIAESFHDVGAQRSAAAPVRLPPVRELVWVPHDWIRCVGSCGELSAASVAHQVVALVCVQPRPTAQRAQRVHHGPRVTRRARLAQLPPVGDWGYNTQSDQLQHRRLALIIITVLRESAPERGGHLPRREGSQPHASLVRREGARCLLLLLRVEYAGTAGRIRRRRLELRLFSDASVRLLREAGVRGLAGR